MSYGTRISFEAVIALIVVLSIFLIVAHANMTKKRISEEVNRKRIKRKLHIIDKIEDIFFLDGIVPLTEGMKALLCGAIERRISIILSMEPDNIAAKQRMRSLNEDKGGYPDIPILSEQELLSCFVLPNSKEDIMRFSNGLKKIEKILRLEAKESPEKIMPVRDELLKLRFLQLRLIIDTFVKRANYAYRKGAYENSNELINSAESYLKRAEVQLYKDYTDKMMLLIDCLRKKTTEGLKKRQCQMNTESDQFVNSDGLTRMFDVENKVRW